MAVDLNDLHDDLAAIVAAVWTDVVHSGDRAVYEAEHVETLDLETLVLPYAVIAFPEFPRGNMGPLDRQTWEPVAEIYYVGESTGRPRTIRTKLEALTAYLLASARDAEITEGQIISVDSESVSRSLPFNQVLRAKKVPAQAGMVRVSLLVGMDNGTLG